MANEEHLKILRQGVEVWNEWRSENEGVTPDLREADLIEANLIGANLNGVVLHGAHLSGALLNRASLREAKLVLAKLTLAKLSNADLREVDLREAHLNGADLRDAELRRVDFRRAYLFRANLSGAILREAKLRGADLTYANLNNTDLQNVSLQTARLIETKLDEANLTDACLWETQRAGWSIKGIICESVYWDKDAKEKTIYAPGEFERLFTDKTRIKLHYKNGISILEIAALPALIQYLEETQGCSLRFVKINEDAGGAVVELAIEDTDNKSPEQVKQLQAALQKEAQEKVEYQRLALVERETRLELQGEVKQLNAVVDKLILRPSQYINNQGVIMADNKSGDTYNISGQAGAVGPNAQAHDMTFNQLVNNVEQSIDLAALATQLSELRQAMAAKQDASPQAAIAIGRVAEAEIAATEKNTSKVIEHLKAAGQWTLDFAKAVGKDVVVAAIKKAMGME